MAWTLAADPIQLEKLRAATYQFCDAADVELALRRYPGNRGRGDTFPDRFTLDSLTQSCIDVLSRENPYYALSFVLRLIEQKWSSAPLRRSITYALPALVRPPRGFDPQIAAVEKGLGVLAEALPENPGRGSLGDETLFRGICENRGDIEAVASSLERLGALKALHDALHMLQVLGSGWLSPVAARPLAGEAASIQALLQGVTAAAAADTFGLPPDMTAAFERCRDGAADAARRLGTGDGDEAAFACASLRALLIREPPLIDEAMLALWRDLPWRSFCALFPTDPTSPALVEARDAAIDLGDTLRRRLMEHALWQASDLRVYAVEELLSRPAAPPLADLQPVLLPLLNDLRTLLDPSAVARAVTPMGDAILRHLARTDPGVGRAPPTPDDAGDLRDAFDEVRRCARSAFLDVDQKLRADLTRLLTLKGPIELLLARVPPHCGFLLL